MTSKSYLGFFTAVGGVIAFMANLGSIVDFVTTKLNSSCSTLGIEWCSTAQIESPTVDPIGHKVLPGRLAVNVEPRYTADSQIAAILTTNLAAQLGELSSEAGGYIVDATVSKTQLSSSGSTAFEFEWSLSLGKVTRFCKPIAIQFRSEMAMLAASRVASHVKPFLERSIQFEDVRC